jgi:hypothetical protein
VQRLPWSSHGAVDEQCGGRGMGGGLGVAEGWRSQHRGSALYFARFGTANEEEGRKRRGREKERREFHAGGEGRGGWVTFTYNKKNTTPGRRRRNMRVEKEGSGIFRRSGANCLRHFRQNRKTGSREITCNNHINIHIHKNRNAIPAHEAMRAIVAEEKGRMAQCQRTVLIPTFTYTTILSQKKPSRVRKSGRGQNRAGKSW